MGQSGRWQLAGQWQPSWPMVPSRTEPERSYEPSSELGQHKPAGQLEQHMPDAVPGWNIHRTEPGRCRPMGPLGKPLVADIRRWRMPGRRRMQRSVLEEKIISQELEICCSLRTLKAILN